MRKNTRVRGKRQPLLDDFLSGVNHLWRWARVHAPLYILAGGLTLAYGWGWLSTYPGVFGVALACGAFAAAFLLPALGDMIEDQRLVTPWKANAAAALALVFAAFNALSGFVAYNAAEAPQHAYEASAQAIADAEADEREARTALDAFACSRDMPASRCEVFRAQNAGAEARAAELLARATAALAVTRENAAPAPDVTVPAVAVWIKVFLGLMFDAILFFTPWAARAERDGLTPAPAPVVEAKAAQPAPAAAVAVRKKHDGGWATRRAKYGASGRRRRGKPDLRIVEG